MKNKIHSLWSWAKRHKFWSILIAVLVIWGIYRLLGVINPTSEAVRYVTSPAEKGQVVVSVSGAGQVSASTQVDLKAKASGEVTAIYVKDGQAVKAGTIVAQLDTTDALKSIRDAETSLETAQLSLEKLKQPADQLSLIKAENSLAKAKESKTNAEDDLKKSYDDGFNLVSNAYLDLPTVMTGLQNNFFTSNSNLGGQWGSDFYAAAAGTYEYYQAEQYKKDLLDDYATARLAYDQAFAAYKLTSRFSEVAEIEASISKTYEVAKLISEAVKSANNLVQFYNDQVVKHNIKPNSESASDLSTLSSYTSQVNGHLSSLLNAQNSIKSAKDAIVNAERSIQENSESLTDLKNGADPLDIRSSEISVTQRENSLRDAREKLADYYIKAPFDGVIAVLNVKKSDSVSSGTSVASLVTVQKIAEITLNEVDVAKVAAGQKATLTFDALPDLVLAGQVISVDSLGTVSQGVVNYAVKVGFDADGTSIKPGMSVSAAIVTEISQDAVYVPSSAIKSQNGSNYVEIIDSVPENYNSAQGFVPATAPRQQVVEIGLANDTQTEIKSGLKEGEQVVIRTISPASAATTQSAPSAASLFGGGRNPGR